MIHNPWSVAMGEAKDMRHMADILDEVKEAIVNAYQFKTQRSRKKISQMMDEETWMGAKKALSEGFIDEILYAKSKETPVENSLMFSRRSIQNSVAVNTNRLAKFYEQNIEPPPENNLNPPIKGQTDENGLLSLLQARTLINRNRIGGKI